MEEILNIYTNVSRSCSYCRSNEHTIRYCNSADIDVLLNCLQQAFLIIRQSHTQIDGKVQYTNWLLNSYTLHQLKVVAVTRMNSRISGFNKADYADTIWNCNNSVYEVEEVEVEVEEVEEVGWSIDRLPNPNPEITFDGFQTPPTMSPRDPPEVVRAGAGAFTYDEGVGFGYRSNISYMSLSTAIALIDLRETRYNISITKQELIGLSELLEDDFECSICYELKNKSLKLVLGCDHEYCTECIIKMLKISNSNKPRCAFCRDEMKQMIVYNNEELNKLNDSLNF